MLKNRRLKEAIENVGMVNNIDGQNFEKDFVGTAPVSYADAVLRARKRKEACKKAYEDQVKVAKEALKKEVSNEEHPEPLGKIRGRKEKKMTLDEGLFESFDDEHLGHGDDVCPKCGKEPCECNIVARKCLKESSDSNESDLKNSLESAGFKVKEFDKNEDGEDYVVVDMAELLNYNPVVFDKTPEGDYYTVNFEYDYRDRKCPKFEEDYSNIDDVIALLNDLKNNFNRFTIKAGNYSKDVSELTIDDLETAYDKGDPFKVYDYKGNLIASSDDFVYNTAKQFYDTIIDRHTVDSYLGSKESPKSGLNESVIRYPNGKEVTDIDLDKALDYQYGTDRDMDNSKYTDDEKQRAVNYWLEKTDGLDPYELSKEEVKPLEKSKKDARVFRVTYKHSPTVFSSVMVKAASEDEAKQKLAVKEPGKDIVGVTVMSDDEIKDMTNRGMSLMEAKVFDDFSSYEPWGAAVSTFDSIQNADKMDALEQLIDDMYPDGINKTELNDLLAFESDWVYSMLAMPHDEDVVYDDVAVEIEDDEEE